MIKKTRLVPALLLLGASGLVFAEGGTCPPGYYPIGGPGAMGCAPMPGYGYEQAQPMEPRWASRWGAIAIDRTNGVLGAAVGKKSERRASKAAMAECRAKMGEACEVMFAYRNQCAAVAWGDDGLAGGAEPAIGDAGTAALISCGQYTKNCRIYYHGCSLPVRTE